MVCLIMLNCCGKPRLADYYQMEEVPYRYCFDLFRGNLDCQTWDEGASYTDTVRAAIQNYWNYYVFNNYRRGRMPNSFINGFFARESRVGWYLTTFFRFYYFYQQWDIGLRDDLLEASLVGLNFINQVLGTPEPGTHCYDEASNTYVHHSELDAETVESCDAMAIPDGIGRRHNNKFSEEYYAPTIDYIGSYYAKLGVLYHLADTSSQFFRVSNTADERFFSIGYYRVFKKELMNLFRGMMLSWLNVSSSNGFQAYADTQTVLPRALVAPEAFGQDPLTWQVHRKFARR